MDRSSPWRRRALLAAFIGVLSLVLAAGQVADGYAAGQGPDDDPRLRLRATPRVAFAGQSFLFVGQIRGGPDDNEELYCATIEWDWGDDTYSESTPDCDPFEPGRSENPAPFLDPAHVRLRRPLRGASQPETPGRHSHLCAYSNRGSRQPLPVRVGSLRRRTA